MRIFVSGVGKRNALIKLLIKEGESFGVDIIGGDADNFPPARVVLSEFRKLPLASSEFFIEEYQKILFNEKIDAYLSLIDPEIPFLGSLESKFSDNGPRLLHPCSDVSRLCEDKYNFASSANLNGIKHIPTSLKPLSSYPFIQKERCGSAASGFKVFYSLGEFELESRHENNYIYQPFCNGIHYCIDAYYSIFTNKIIDLCVKRVINKSKGESFLLETAPAEKFLPFLEKISSWITLRGIVNFDIYENEGDLIVMEINCRIGGNYPASHAFGCNLIKHMMKEITSDQPVELSLSNYESGLLAAKYFEFTEPVLAK